VLPCRTLARVLTSCIRIPARARVWTLMCLSNLQRQRRGATPGVRHLAGRCCEDVCSL
jgi:hypothetical protein